MKTMLFAWMTGFILITFEGGHMELSAQEPLPAVITRAPVLITPLQMEFLNTIYDTYTTGNSVREDGCLDFEGGFQNALDFLKSKIGSQYNDEFGFIGFDITVASTVVQADPPGMPDVVHARNGSIGIRSGKDVEKLFDEGPPLISVSPGSSLQCRVATATRLSGDRPSTGLRCLTFLL